MRILDQRDGEWKDTPKEKERKERQRKIDKVIGDPVSDDNGNVEESPKEKEQKEKIKHLQDSAQVLIQRVDTLENRITRLEKTVEKLVAKGGSK